MSISQRIGRRRFDARLLLLGMFVLPAVLSSSPVAAQGWGFAWEIGAETFTPGPDPFIFRLTASRNSSPEFGIAPSVCLTPQGDNTLYSGSVNAEFHIAMTGFRLSPFFGLGVVHRGTKHDNDSALLIPMGASVDRPIGESLYIVGTAALNLHGGMELDGRKDNSSLGLTAGIRYAP